MKYEINIDKIDISSIVKNDIVDLNMLQQDSDSETICKILINSDQLLNLTFLLPTNCHGLFYEKNVDVHPNWSTANVQNMGFMFCKASIKNAQLLSSWDVSKVNNMRFMFEYSDFNQDISSWDVSKVNTMQFMFAYSDFNQDISSWDVSNVENVTRMFYASKFNQDISSWKLHSIKYTQAKSGMFFGSKFSFMDKIKHWPFFNVRPFYDAE